MIMNCKKLNEEYNEHTDLIRKIKFKNKTKNFQFLYEYKWQRFLTIDQ